MKLFVNSILVGFLLVSVQSCTTSQALLLVDTTNALYDLRAEYDSVKDLLHNNLHMMEKVDREKLLELEEQCNFFVNQLETDWKESEFVVLSNAEHYYDVGKEIYLRGAEIVKPYIQRMSPIERYYLKKFKADAQIVETLYEKMRKEPTVRNRYRLIESGMKFATLALRVGIVAM